MAALTTTILPGTTLTTEHTTFQTEAKKPTIPPMIPAFTGIEYVDKVPKPLEPWQPTVPVGEMTSGDWIWNEAEQLYEIAPPLDGTVEVPAGVEVVVVGAEEAEAGELIGAFGADGAIVMIDAEAEAVAAGGAGAVVVGEEIAVEGAAAVAGEELGAAALGAGSAMAGALGAAAVTTGIVATVAVVVLGVLCVVHALPMCKKKVCTDPNGNWHSHHHHCNLGCRDKNGYWHRRADHCENEVCQDLNGFWHTNRDRCDKEGCKDPNGKVRTHPSHCKLSHFKCKDPRGIWHVHGGNCKRDLIAERDAAFARPDLLSIDNSYIVILNAEKFQATELEVLKEMVIMPTEDPDDTDATFEGEDGEFYAEGQLSEVEYATDVWTGNFTFPYPGSGTQVEGKWLVVDPASQAELSQKLLSEIKQVHEHLKTGQ